MLPAQSDIGRSKSAWVDGIGPSVLSVLHGGRMIALEMSWDTLKVILGQDLDVGGGLVKGWGARSKDFDWAMYRPLSKLYPLYVTG